MEDNKNILKAFGTPTLLLLPPKRFSFLVDTQYHSFTIPRKGKYVDLDPNFFTDKDGEFDILADVESDGVSRQVLYLPSITKVLFAVSKYPYLNDDEVFVPALLVFEDDNVTISGNVLKMLSPNKKDDVSDESEEL